MAKMRMSTQRERKKERMRERERVAKKFGTAQLK